MCTLVVWVNRNLQARLTKPQFFAVSERIAGITLNVNTAGYSRRKDDALYLRDAGANVLELGRRIELWGKINRWRQESVLCIDAVELSEAEVRPLT
jgi:hypothetical protein